MNPVDQFRDALMGRGLVPPDYIEADGRLHRCDAEGKNGRNDGAYLLHLDGIPAGGFQNHRDGLGWESWRADLGRRLTPQEEAAHKARVHEVQRYRDAERERERKQAAAEAISLWNSGDPDAAADHPYLKRKGVGAHGLRVHDGSLLVPMRDANALHSLQRISPEGEKRFLTGGRKQGCFYSIGQLGDVICVVEGFATGASVHEASGHAVAVAFDCGNLLPVAQALRWTYPQLRIILCADDDHRTDGNPGLTKAREAASVVGGLLAMPDFGDNRAEGATDFNDLHQALGLDAVRRCIEDAQDAHNLLTPEVEQVEQLEQDREDGQRRSRRGEVVLVRGTEIEPAPIEWLWPQWLALGKLHLLGGAPGQGKTTIAMSMSATVTTGGRWPCGARCEPGNVLIWSGEDDFADTLLPRLTAMGVNRDRLFFIKGARIGREVLPFDPARDLANLAEVAKQIGNVRLLVVDPVVSAVRGDSHKNTEVRRALQPLVDLAAQLRASVIGITHLSKGTAGRDPTERITGSIAFTAVVRVVLLAAKVKDADGEDKRILVRSKSNIGPDDGGYEYRIEQTMAREGIPASMVTWGERIEGTARDLLADAEAGAGDAQPAREAAEAFLRELLDVPTPAKRVEAEAKEAGHSWATVKRAADGLGVLRKRAPSGGGHAWYWSLQSKAPKLLKLLNSQGEQVDEQLDAAPIDEADVEVFQCAR